jgi:putative membrane protein
MKNILNILKHDARRLTSSVVAIITIMGLCIIPCLYAWFNIFSNWAPYESEATGRIRVAVANDDKGAEMLGLSVNVGDKITEALKANNDIGWEFAENSDAAVEGVYAGDYYAALIIPEDFSRDVLSFVTGDLQNPKLIYYENEKKNAIAPKITGKAKSAVQEQVDAAFIETLAKYVSDAASVANAAGYDPQKVFSDLGSKMTELNARLEDASVMLSAADGLADSAASLMNVSDQLLADAETSLEGQEAIIGSASGTLPDTSASDEAAAAAVEEEKQLLISDIEAINNDIVTAAGDVISFNKFVTDTLPGHSALVDRMIESCERTEKYLTDLGYTALAAEFAETRTQLEDVQKSLAEQKEISEEKWADKEKELSELRNKLDNALKKAEAIDSELAADLSGRLDNVISEARSSMTSAQNALAGMQGDLSDLEELLDGYSYALADLQDSLGSTGTSLGYVKNGVNTLAAIFSRLAGNESLEDINDILANEEASVAEYLSSPVRMKTEVIYPIREYGSAMAPFYTVLAQWVGALLTAVLIKTEIRKRKDLTDIRLHERFFGRFGLYLFVGLAQALIVSLGDLLYVGIQCHHPILFVLQACMNGITFMMINYALVFALENIGLGAGVIILVLQVAGSGGTYPVEVLPKVFRVLYPAMPFRYSMDAMRECIAGTYDHTYLKCMGVLCLFTIGSAILGMLLQRPASVLNRMIAEGKENSEIML